jgi:pre-mRNA-splicing helicase BRR2
MLTILHEMSKHYSSEMGVFDLTSFKIVYIAPMKALVQEMVGNFSNRLKHYNMKVGELTGDSQMTKQQISEASIIVTTPEKWDVITRKQTSYTNLVRLIIVDEIHLLHDEHGPVIEALIARTIRRTEQTSEYALQLSSVSNRQRVSFILMLRTDPGAYSISSLASQRRRLSSDIKL